MVEERRFSAVLRMLRSCALALAFIAKRARKRSILTAMAKARVSKFLFAALKGRSSIPLAGLEMVSLLFAGAEGATVEERRFSSA